MARGRHFEEGFKIQTGKGISENNKPIAQAARVAGVNANTLHSWVALLSLVLTCVVFTQYSLPLISRVL